MTDEDGDDLQGWSGSIVFGKVEGDVFFDENGTMTEVAVSKKTPDVDMHYENGNYSRSFF